MSDHGRVFTGFVEEIQERAGASLKSIVVYGSAAGPHFRPGVSDYNFLVVADPVNLALLERLSGLAGKWRKRRITPPLVVQPVFIESALDSWPLEFLSMKARYQVLSGADPLAAVSFQKEHVRLQCEREIRSKMLLFQRAYLDGEGAPKRLKSTLDRGWPALVAIVRGILFLKDGPWQADGEEAWGAAARLAGIPADMLPALHALRAARSVPERKEITARYDQVLETLRRLSDEVDKW
jgi:predicted nucleotidyltransferase